MGYSSPGSHSTGSGYRDNSYVLEKVEGQVSAYQMGFVHSTGPGGSPSTSSVGVSSPYLSPGYSGSGGTGILVH